MDFKSARHWAKEYIEETLFPGAVAVDATMGNGHDTLWLCGLVGETGKVYAFDVQKEALLSTEKRLSENGVLARAELFHAGHERMAEFVPGPVDAVVFNLGWLPGCEHAVTTRVETTLRAVSQAAALLAPGGVMTVCIYPGHEEGAREREALLQWASALDPLYDVLLRRYLNQPNDPPELIAIRRKLRKGEKPCKAE